MLGGHRKKYSSSPALGMPGRRLRLYGEDARGERCQKTLQVWPSVKHVKGELSYAPKRDQEPGSCRVIHACVGGRREFAGTSQQPPSQRSLRPHTPAWSRQDSFTGWLHQARKPKPWALHPQPKWHLLNYRWRVSTPVLGTIPPT